MKKISLALIILILVGICIPAVSAETVLNEHLTEWVDYGKTGKFTFTSSSGSLSRTYNSFTIPDISQVPELYYVAYQFDSPLTTLPEGVNEFTYTIPGKPTKYGRVHVDHSRNILGSITQTRLTFFFDEWDVTGLTGQQIITTNITFSTASVQTVSGNYEDVPMRITTSSGISYPRSYICTLSAGSQWESIISADQYERQLTVKLQRIVNEKSHHSTLKIIENGSTVYDSFDNKDVELHLLINPLIEVEIISPNNVYKYQFTAKGTSTPDESAVTVYVKNSQNGALIANSHIDISAFVNGEFHEVVNETLPGGIYTGNLQPTGGGLPNPDYYRLIATAEGYNSIMPYIDFEHDSDTTIYAILDPVGGAPVDENNTFIDFYVRDINANPISGATVNFGGYTLYTNSAGYTIFEVEKDNTYTWTVSKLGYGSVTGNAVIGSNARYTINAVIAPEVTPTTPTPKPSVTPVSPTPTLTAPTGEPVSNWLEWFAAHFGMILGGGVEIGKIFMWLCFTVPVGVYVGNKAKAGAAGFMAGAGIVTLFFVLIGWVPIWLVVLLALLIGLLYAKVYSNTDNGGGR